MHFKLKDEKLLKEGVKIFKSALPDLLQVPDSDIHLQILLDNLLTIPCIVEADKKEPYSWFSVLTNVCAGFQKAEGERIRAVAKIGCQLFMNCTHPDKVKILTGKHDKKLISSSCDLLASLFLSMPEPECLEESRWNTLIQGLSNPSMERMALQLFRELDTLPATAAYLSHRALAILIRHTKPSNAQSLEHLEEYCKTATGDHFHFISVRCEPMSQLRLHSQWVSTLASLTQKCKEFEREPPLVLRARKIALATNLTTTACALIKDDDTYKLYFPYLLRALGNDFEVMGAIHDNLVTGEVEGLKQFKSHIAQKIKFIPTNE